jgi:plasmid maintenance system antidote protein VapI
MASKFPVDIMFSVRMLASYMKISIEELARNSGISADHLKNVSAKRTNMTADDIVKLSAYTGIPVENIEH